MASSEQQASGENLNINTSSVLSKIRAIDSRSRGSRDKPSKTPT